jgi:protease-4
MSLLLNFAALGLIIVWCSGFSAKRFGASVDGDQEPLTEKTFAGKKTEANKIAIITLEGIIMEGRLDFVHRQIEQAENDPSVKAVVFRINSPGGSITASDDLHRRMAKLTAVDATTGQPKRPLYISMGSMAASGGYYVAMPGQYIFCERTGVTGSVGVYAAFPHAGKKVGEWFDMVVIKQGEIKDSGSPFKDMSPKEVEVWQDMVDGAYRQFVKVCEDGRPNLKGKMLEEIVIKPKGRDGVEEKAEAKWLKRYRADGGIFTAEEALTYGLIDQEGTLEDAVEAVAKKASLASYRAVEYEKAKTLTDVLLGAKAPQTPTGLDASKLEKGLMPRLWLLAPGCELAGFAAAVDGQ